MLAPCFASVLLACSLAAQEEAPRLSVVAVRYDGTAVPMTAARILKGWKLQGRIKGEETTLAARELVALRFTNQPPRAFPEGPQLVFPTGERLACRVRTMTDDEKLTVNGALIGEGAVPLSTVLGIVLQVGDADSPQVEDLVGKIRATDRNSDRLLLENRDEIAGTFLGIDERRIRLDRGGSEFAVNRDLVAAVAFDPSLVVYRPGSEFYGQLRLTDGSVVNVASLASEGRSLVLTTSYGAEFRCDASEAIDLSFRNGRVVYLSDLKPTEVIHRPFLDDEAPPRFDRSVLGGPLTLGRRVYAKGIGVRSYSSLTYPLDGFQKFQATVGLDDAAGPEASVRFTVAVDGKQAFDSGEVVAGSEPKEVSVPVENARRLTLTVDFANRGDVQDYADWCNARLIR